MKNNIHREYATVVDDEGVNYREIADTMSELGFPMGHSSARNYIIRIMQRFASAISDRWNIDIDDDALRNIAMSSSFQSGIADLLHVIEAERREGMKRAP